MTTVDQTVVAMVNASPDMLALLSTPFTPARNIAEQFKPDTIGTAARPAIAYQRISNPRDQTLRKASALGRLRMQFTLFARSASERSALKAALRKLFDNYTDRNTGGVIDRMLYDNERDTHDGATGDYMSMVDYIIWHIEV